MSGLRVLVVDADEAARSTLAEMIDLEPALDLCGSADDMELAVTLATTEQPDVVLIDVRLPGGGDEAARRVMRASPHSRILALSAHSEWEYVLDMLRAGAIGYLVKGDPAERIVDACRYAARGEAILSRETTAQVMHELVLQLDRSERQSDELKTLDETKSELIQTLAHELLTPVTVLQAFTALVAEQRLPPERLAASARVAGHASHRLARLIHNIVTAARLDRPGQRLAASPVPISAIVSSALAQLDPDAACYDVQLANFEQLVWADSDLASRALANVLENALALADADHKVEVLAEATRHDVHIHVSDRGPGIPAVFRSKLFDPFTHGDIGMPQEQSGVGLGLYLVRRIMLAHGGSVNVEDRPGGGSTFVLSFPAVLAARASRTTQIAG